MATTPLFDLTNSKLDPDQPILLYDGGDHKIYWVGVHSAGEEIECNSYLIIDAGAGYLLEPGGFDRFAPVFKKVCYLISPSAVSHMYFSHQDPDICASFPSWIKWNEDIQMIVSSLWTRFMPHYESRELSGKSYKLNFIPVGDEGATLPLKAVDDSNASLPPTCTHPEISCCSTQPAASYSAEMSERRYSKIAASICLSTTGRPTRRRCEDFTSATWPATKPLPG